MKLKRRREEIKSEELEIEEDEEPDFDLEDVEPMISLYRSRS
jgi:hypothetical protein